MGRVYHFITKMYNSQSAEVWERLIGGKSLEGLGLSIKDGRIDLSGLFIPDPIVTNQFSTKIADVKVLGNLIKIKKANWNALDFTGSRLNHFLFFDSIINDCIFDKCSCQNWGMWGTTISNTRFHATDLRDSALGGIDKGKRNVFRKVDFTKGDLRRIACTSAEFIDCLFRDTKLNKVNFGGSQFVRCTFEGELREVCFNRYGFRAEKLPPNEMIDVDFSRAQLRTVEFRELDLDKVRFPEDEDHVILTNYPEALDRIIGYFKGKTDVSSRMLVADLGCLRKWVGPRQRQGVLNKKDLVEGLPPGGEEELIKKILELISESQAPRSKMSPISTVYQLLRNKIRSQEEVSEK